MSKMYPASDPRYRAVTREMPGVLVRLAPLLDTEDPNWNRNVNALDKWVTQKPARMQAFMEACLTLLLSSNITPGTVRGFAQAIEQADIKAWKPQTKSE